MHKRVLLHPISAFLLLCIGVLVAGSTFPGLAATYDVTATVPAVALTEAAIIKQPTDQKHVSSPLVDVQGDCPDDSYVKLYHDGVLGGVDVCNNGGHFHIQTSLLPGANELKARVFNLTDNEGPDFAPITVYYDLPPVVTLPTVEPLVNLIVSNVEQTSLIISSVDANTYDAKTVREVTSNPTVGGLAPPFSDIVVTFYSKPSICKTKADSKGVWTCTLAHALTPGVHHVVIQATTLAGKKLTFPTFEVRVAEYVQPFSIISDYKYQAHAQGKAIEWKLAVVGGTPPYQLSIDWGDGNTDQISRPDQSEFTISHVYDGLDTAERYAVIIQAEDARGATTVLQLAAAMRGGGASVGTDNGIFAWLINSVRDWLWVVWPAYIAVVLMVLSFWIGEREAYQRFMARRRSGSGRPRPHARGR